MSKRLTVLCVIGLVVMLVAIQRFQRPAKPTIFAEMNFEQAQAAAMAGASDGRAARLLVVDFGADWCPPCREMDRGTWTDSELTSWLREHAVSIKIDIDEDPGRARGFGVTAVPTVVVLNGTKEVGRVTGLVGASELLAKLKGLADKP